MRAISSKFYIYLVWNICLRWYYWLLTSHDRSLAYHLLLTIVYTVFWNVTCFKLCIQSSSTNDAEASIYRSYYVWYPHDIRKDNKPVRIDKTIAKKYCRSVSKLIGWERLLILSVVWYLLSVLQCTGDSPWVGENTFQSTSSECPSTICQFLNCGTFLRWQIYCHID